MDNATTVALKHFRLPARPASAEPGGPGGGRPRPPDFLVGFPGQRFTEPPAARIDLESDFHFFARAEASRASEREAIHSFSRWSLR